MIATAVSSQDDSMARRQGTAERKKEGRGSVNQNVVFMRASGA
jgi:hypothetical protein